MRSHRWLVRLFSWMLVVVLLGQLLSSFSAIPPTFAAALGKPHNTPGALTFQQYLKQGRQDKVSHTPVHPHFGPPPHSPAPDGRPVALPSSTEAPTMKPLTATLSPSFLSNGPGAKAIDLKSSDGRLEVQLAPGTFDLTHATVASGTATRKTKTTGSVPPSPTTHTTPTTPPTETKPIVTPTTGATGKATPTAHVTPKVTPSVTTTSVTPTATPGPSKTSPASPTVTGALTLTITEQHGYFVGENVSLGSYQFQFADGQGHTVSGVAVQQPITILYHYQPSVMQQFDLDPGQLFLSWPLVAQAAQKAHQSPMAVTATTVVLRNDPQTHTLSAQTKQVGPGPFTLSGDPVNLSPPSPLVGSVQGNAGQLSYSYPLDTPPGPAGFGPNLSLSYSSETVNERHAYNQPGADFGDGWSLSLGAITADVHAANSDGGGLTWYNLSGVDGISDRLVPNPNDQTQFLTQHLSYLRIRMITSLCFNVWDKDGTEYEFGCADGTVQWHKDSTGQLTNYRWDLSKIIAPNEGSGAPQKTITIAYFQDCAPTFTDPCPAGPNASNGEAIRDDAIKQITVSAGSTVVSTTDFFYNGPETITDSGHTWVTQYSSSYYSNCHAPASTSTRCDDPVSYSGGVPAPQVMATLSPTKIISYVGPDTGTGSYSAYEYDFQFNETAFSSKNPVSGNQCTDPTTNPGVNEYCAGEHLLTQITPLVYQSGTAHTLKPVLFHYYQFTNTYSDHSSPNPMPNGGLYSIATGWQYMDYYYDSNSGVGAHVFYQRAYSNTHGTPYDSGSGSGSVGYMDNRFDPTYCFTHVFDSNPALDCNTSGSAFNYPDDRAWTNQVVTKIVNVGSDSSALSSATTIYSYGLESINNNCTADTASPPDTYCVTDIWSPPTDGAWQDFYDSEYRGMASVLETSPAGNLTASYYIVSDGPGSNSWDSRNYNSGSLYQQDIYQGSSTSSPLLQETWQYYTGYQPNKNYPSTPGACNGNYSGVYNPCEVILLGSVTASCEGISGCNAQNISGMTWPQTTTTDTYDDYSTSSGYNYSSTVYHNLQSEVITSNDAPTLTKKWTYKPDDQTIGSTVYYDVNKVVHSEVDDASGTAWQCQDIIYDEGNNSGVASGTPVAGWPTTSTTYSNCADTAHTAITAYDAYGNVVATVDGVASSNSALYGSTGTSPYNGCTLATTPVIKSSNWSKTNYTTCTTYDQYAAQPVTVTNAFSYSNTLSYDYTQGALPTSVTDYNNQQTKTAYSFDSGSATNGKRITDISQPGESAGYTTQTNSYSSCATSIPSGTILPCFQENETTSQYASVLSSTFYDSMGRVVETSTPAPLPASPQSGMSYFTVVLRSYNDQQNTAWQSNPFVVAVPTASGGQTTSSGWFDPASAKDYTGVSPVGTMTYLDALERPIAMKDPLFGAPGVPGVACSATLLGNYTSCTNYGVGQISGDSNYYLTVTAVDPNGHISEGWSDGLGRALYSQDFSGRYGGTLTPIAQTSTQYNVLNLPTQVKKTDLVPQTNQSITSVTTTASYDSLGRVTQSVDPDTGTSTYTYDANGQTLSVVNGTRTIGTNYDLLGRVGCVEDAAPTINATGACTSGAHPYEQNIYDIHAPNAQWGSPDYPVGHLTQSIATTYYPDDTSTTSTDNTQYDTRGRAITRQLKLSVPSTWNLTTALPTYQLAAAYNDANQPTTIATSTVASNGNSTPGYTMTQVYDTTTGVLVGLGTMTSQTANLASVLYNPNALLDTLNFATSTGSSTVASEQFTYDGDLRPTGSTATWQSGSGTSGTIFSQGRNFDPASNVTSLTSSLAAVPGHSGSGGTETQNFCYNEQDQLVWAGNSGTQPSAGNGTCGSGTLANTLTGAAYSNAFVYTHLGQLWQGPLNGGSVQYQYEYCNSNAPHQLNGMYPIGTTCANLSGAVYKTSYDAWGNATSRTYSSNSTTQSFDLLNQLVKWNLGTSQKAWYAYDAGGERTVQRTTNGTTTMTVYAFGSEEYQYDGSGNLQSSTHYYALGGRLIGELTGSGTPTTSLFVTDELGSVLATFSNTQDNAAVQGNQTYGPYGSQQYQQGSMNTAKGYTGQYADPLTGFDYYNARYYDPVAGVFLSADSVQGNVSGMNPYAYVGGNPETRNDPTGKYYSSGGSISNGGSIGYVNPNSGYITTVSNNGNGGFRWVDGSYSYNYGSMEVNTFTRQQQARYGSYNPDTDPNNSPAAKLAQVTGWNDLQQTWNDPTATGWDKTLALGRFAATNLNNIAQLGMIFGGPEGEEGAALEEGASAAEEEAGTALEKVASECGGLSFTPTTPVTTDHGTQAIGTMHVGEKVLAYNPASHKMELEPVLHVWINHDNDLVDMTLTTTTHAPHSPVVSTKSEVIHTNKKHPFLTKEQGFLPVARITLGMHILRADGTYGVVTGWRVVSGVKAMYNLEVAQDHTFTVGVGQWVVHNCGGGRYDLSSDENLGGHTLSRHVNVSEDDTFLRQTSGNKSAFYSKDVAEESIQHILDNQSPVIQGSMRVYEGAFTRNVGYFYDVAGNRWETNFLRVVQAPSSSGWYILTAYPVP